jgi:hypothetical protein
MFKNLYPSSTPEKELQKKFISLASALSPENLSCDGELTMAEQNKQKKILMTKWKQLEEEMGYPVSEDEVWSWTRNRF